MHIYIYDSNSVMLSAKLLNFSCDPGLMRTEREKPAEGLVGGIEELRVTVNSGQDFWKRLG